MDDDQKFELKQWLRENLSLNIKSESHMVGCGDYEWKDFHTIQLILDGEVISEECLS